MILQNLILLLVCFWFSEVDSEFSQMVDDKNSNVPQSAFCVNYSDLVSKWEDATRIKLEKDISKASSSSNTTRRGRRGKRKNIVLVKLSNKKRRRKRIGIKAEEEYKIEIINKLQTKVEVLLVVDFQNKSECGVGALTKGELNNTKMMGNDSSNCLSIETSVEPRRRTVYPFFTPKCGCFIFRYQFAFRDANATTIKRPDQTSTKPHKKLTKILCVQSEEDFEENELKSWKAKKAHRRKGKKWFLKKNQRKQRKQNRISDNTRRVLSRSKKDVFQFWEAQGRSNTSNPTYLPLDNQDNAIYLSENGHEYDIAESEINIDEIYKNAIPGENDIEEHDEYENGDEDKNIKELERNFIEDFEYEDENEEDEINFNDYEKEDATEENDSENDEEKNEVNYDEDDSEDEESNENDEDEHHEYDSISSSEVDDLSDNENYDKEYETQEDEDKSCESDESDESSEENETEVINDSEEDHEKEDENVENDNSINSIDSVYNNRNNIRPRLNRRRKHFTAINKDKIRKKHRFPRRRTHKFISRRRNDLPLSRNRTLKAFKPWKENNRAQWQRRHRSNVNSIRASSVCCRHGVNRKKLILHNKLENNSEFNKTCEDIPSKVLNWAEESFNVTEEFCQQKFTNCCNEWSLLSPNFRVPFVPSRRQVFL